MSLRTLRVSTKENAVADALGIVAPLPEGVAEASPVAAEACAANN